MIDYINKNKTLLFDLFVFLFLISLFNVFFPLHTNKTQYPILFNIENGETVSKVAENLKTDGLISFPILFKLSVFFHGGVVRHGNYYLEKENSIFALAYHITSTNKKTPVVKIQIPNGSNIYEIADIIQKDFQEFDTENFIKEAFAYEGMLYPDTYFLVQGKTPNPQTVIQIMKKTFDKETKEIRKAYKNKQPDFKEILILASIVELEAYKKNDQRKISGVLKNRLERDILLQVDVSFKYINGKNTYNLTTEDLKISNPYNSYVNKGLPPTPIGSPSVKAIDSVINDIPSNYLYFLSDRYGNTYFSETLKQHNINKRKYI